MSYHQGIFQVRRSMSDGGVADVALQRLMYHWPSVVSQAENEWAQNFARSIQRQARRKGWHPTPKQQEIMRRMVNELFTRAPEEEGGFSVIED